MNTVNTLLAALMSPSSTITIDDLRQLAAEMPEFATKLAIIEARLSEKPSPEEEREYKHLATIAEPEAMLSAMECYLDKWSNHVAAASHLADVRNRYLYLNEARAYDVIVKCNKDISTLSFTEKKENIVTMEEYLDDFANNTSTSGEHVVNVQRWLREAKENFEHEIQQLWDSLFDENHRLKSLDGLKRFIDIVSDYGNYSVDADNAAWEWAMTEDDVMAAVREYQTFVHNLGLHSGEIEGLEALYREWTRVNQSDIFEVIEFARSKSKIPFRKEVDAAIRCLLNGEIEKIEACPAAYHKKEFLALYDILDDDSRLELLKAIGATDETIIERMRDTEPADLRMPPETPLTDIAAMYEENGGPTADFLFLGVANSGKTCMLSRLLSSNNLRLSCFGQGANYAIHLQSYGNKQIATPHTSYGTVALMSCESIKQTKKGDKTIFFNLIEASGEELRRDITFVGNDIEPSQGRMAFFAMPSMLSKVICNNHEKVIFIVIDPTDTSVIQSAVIGRLIDLFGLPENAEVMRRVRAIHFIVTKADTLQGNRLEAAKEVVHRVVNRVSFDHLVWICRMYGINHSRDKEENGLPPISPFSLGRFFPGNIYIKEGVDDEVLLNIIGGYALAMNKKSFIQRLRSRLSGLLAK